MVAARLCEVLAELGIGKTLDSESLDWAFHYEDTRPFLEWICDSLQSGNVVSLQELQEYEALEAAGATLQGEALEEAVLSISVLEPGSGYVNSILGIDSPAPASSSQAALVELCEEAEALQRDISRVESCKAAVGAQAVSLVRSHKELVASQKALRSALADAGKQISARNAEINSAASSLTATAMAMKDTYAQTDAPVFLSFVDLSSYLAQERACSQELDRFFSRLFVEGPAKLAKEPAMPPGGKWGLTQEVTRRFIRGDPGSSHTSREEEIARLRYISAKSRTLWLEARAAAAQVEAELAAAQAQLATERSHAYLDAVSIRRRQVDVETELHSLRTSEKKLWLSVVPQLCQELADLEDTYILEGDYELKILRQRYCITQQKRFIGHVLAQLSRGALLAAALRRDAEERRAARALLEHAASELEGLGRATWARTAACKEVTEQASKSDSGAHTVQMCGRLLGLREAEASGGPLSTERVVAGVRELAGHREALEEQLNRLLPRKRGQSLAELFSFIRRSHALLFPGPSTSCPQLTLPAVQELLDELEQSDAELTRVTHKIDGEHREKTELLRLWGEEMGLERRVMVDFFCNPDRLRATVAELQGRLSARAGLQQIRT